MKQTIQHDFFYAHPIETVWEYFTNADLMGQWLMKNDFVPVVGHEFQFRTGGKPNQNFDGIFYCKVLEIVPFKKLSYTWNCGPGEGEIDLTSVVVWQLEAKDNGTRVHLEHSGFEQPQNFKMYQDLNQGWLELFQKIEKLLKA
jgi:uncharacterized protein YndB with AHSA1/START domain